MECVTSATVIIVKSEFVHDVIGIVFNSIPLKINILLSLFFINSPYQIKICRVYQSVLLSRFKMCYFIKYFFYNV